MLHSQNTTLGFLIRPRTLAAVIAASVLVAGSVTGASAGSRNHHRHHYHHHHHHQAHHAKSHGASGRSWRNAYASFGGSSHSGRSFSGVASYYGNEAGSRTASGQRFNQNAMTAAHRSLPFGTKLRVTHGSRSVVVTVNDRGPFIRGRVLDLSKGAARAIGLTGRGVGRVVAEVM
ncbi:rare lipoprotein A [Nitrobacter sp. Nb-311A]|uniref:septal ring lytic transglycosylase RlpA family protein n=1 Tax=unclassified Nitrobacter TaxID=2620411 RepID=UPI0000686462|nr:MULTISPECIES: septal ring lytic transglycosylase RlpA family protein [unclassified Nitrobacter]EAQ37484.1 rare lipoprotein A [Nitrobacter sp. Nb-311A]MCB1392315.1 septal ring lytic transglycosylase RlpA family protein [Nitrobacter sp.]MCV0385187.1 septal ring lytic transglycosylase RlpA family protein [Nitrobacter sp.]